jgi:hypothetical protein
MATDDARREHLARLICLFLFGAVLAVLMSRHEMWRDELQAWMLARDSGSLTALWANTRYEGHPLLWHVLLLPLAHAFASPVAMQVVHWLVAVAAAGVVLFRAPFALWVRVALVFGYVPLYEYGVISRSYVLSVLGVWLVCAGLASARSPWPAVLGGLVIANSTPIGLMIVPALAAAIALTPSWRRQRPAALAVLTAGFAIGILQCLPAADYAYARRWNLTFNPRLLTYVCRGFTQVLFPIPASTVNFWNSSAFLPAWPFSLETGNTLLFVLPPFVLAVVAGVAGIVRSSRRAVAFWVLSFAGLFTLFYAKMPGQIRHFGLFWAVLVGTLWIASADGVLPRRWVPFILAPTLVAGAWASVTAARLDWRLPFSGTHGAAEAIVTQGLAHLPLVGGADYPSSGVAAYLPQGRLYYPSSRREGSFIVWNQARKRQDQLSQQDVIGEALSRDRGDGVVLLLNAPIPASDPSPCREVYRSGPTVVGDEELWVYRCLAAGPVAQKR